MQYVVMAKKIAVISCHVWDKIQQSTIAMSSLSYMTIENSKKVEKNVRMRYSIVDLI